MPTIEELQKLINNKISPDELLNNVSEIPIVNTFKDDFRNIIEFVDIAPAPGKEEYFHQLKSGNNIVYWKLSENDLGVEIIGVVWEEEQNQKIIYGIILPP